MKNVTVIVLAEARIEVNYKEDGSRKVWVTIKGKKPAGALIGPSVLEGKVAMNEIIEVAEEIFEEATKYEQ